MKSTILSLLCLFTTITLSAQNVELIDGLKIRLPEDYEIVENKNFDLAAVKGSEAILVKMVESDEIDLDKFKTRADRTFFNLQEFQLTDSKSDKFHMLTKDYHKQYYRNANGAEVMTYASHTNDYAYIIYTIPNEFVVGYGLDFNEHYRNLPYIGILKPEVYEK